MSCGFGIYDFIAGHKNKTNPMYLKSIFPPCNDFHGTKSKASHKLEIKLISSIEFTIRH